MDVPTPVLALCAAAASFSQYALPPRQLWDAAVLPPEILEPGLLAAAFNTIVWIACGRLRSRGRGGRG